MSITVKNLRHTYSPKTPFASLALDGVDVTIHDGDYVGIIGHTGSGKSTFVQHLNGLIKLQSGEITVDGIDLRKRYDYKKLRALVGMVFQYPEYQLFDETVERDVGFGPRNLGIGKDEVAQRVQEALVKVGLSYDEIAQKSPFEISGGQKRRVALAGVIAMRPSILVLDEPTAGLDPVGKREILSLIDQLRKDSVRTVVMVSHNMNEVAEKCNRVLVFAKGKIVYDLSPRELFTKGAELRAMGLDVPDVVAIRDRLLAKGAPIAPDVYTKAQLTAELLRWKGVAK